MTLTTTQDPMESGAPISPSGLFGISFGGDGGGVQITGGTGGSGGGVSGGITIGQPPQPQPFNLSSGTTILVMIAIGLAVCLVLRS